MQYKPAVGSYVFWVDCDAVGVVIESYLSDRQRVAIKIVVGSYGINVGETFYPSMFYLRPASESDMLLALLVGKVNT